MTDVFLNCYKKVLPGDGSTFLCHNSGSFHGKVNPLFVESTGNTLHKETIETHREIADAIAAHDPLRAQDAMYLHLVYNRKWICSLSQKQ